MKFNCDVFITNYQRLFNEQLTKPQLSGLQALLKSVMGDEQMTDIRWIAYLLATVKHECANQWHPIEEYSSGEQYEGRADLGNVKPGDGQIYKGIGYVQITGRGNFRKFGQLLSIDLENKPHLALDPSVSYKIASLGMRKGLFTGVGFVNYIHGDVCDYLNSRRIINGLDKADVIRTYAVKLEACLNASHIN